jgi:8-hydroxy-5-deazaflavin:NADPH oxidoreductase
VARAKTAPDRTIYSAVVAPRFTDPVAVIGASGSLGFGLAVRFARAGVPVVIGSRDPDRARETAARVADTIPGSRVPFRNQSETLANLREALHPGHLLIDATVPLAAAVSGKATRMLGVWQGSAAEQAAEMVGEGVRVVSALHTVSAASLTDLEHPLDQDVLVCGDSRADKRDAAIVIDRIEGLRCVDCGGLEMSRITESLTALLISVNSRYKTHAGIRLSGLVDVTWE